MKKLDLFMKAMAAECYRRRAWVVAAFALISEAPDDYKKDPYPYRIIHSPTGYSFVDPEKNGEITYIEDAEAGKPLFDRGDRIDLLAGQVPNLFKDANVPLGNILWNYIVLVFPFGKRIEFQTGRISIGKVEDAILSIFDDLPEKGKEKDESRIYPDAYQVFADAAFYLAGFTQLFTPANTRKSLLAPPGIKEAREKLIAENRENLNNPEVVAKIQKELIAIDAEYLKGDDAEGFLISKKSRNVVRPKLFLMHGAEAGFGEGVSVDVVENSLAEGWDVTKFPAMMNSLRSGSYSRGAETQKGGEAVKWLLRASSNLAITMDDCGTTMGNDIEITTDNLFYVIGFNHINKKGETEAITAENVSSLIGKKVLLRSPMWCKGPKTDYCSKCCGARLSSNPTALSVAVSEYGSAFMALSMKAMHGRELATAHLNFKTALT